MAAEKLPFTKMQAVGNDFVVVEEPTWATETDWPGLAIRLCDRKFGIGGDGLLVLCPSTIADFGMKMFNPDGSEDMCGNGLRCLIYLQTTRGNLAARGTVETLSGLRSFVVTTKDGITTEMGIPRFSTCDIPAVLPSDDTTFALAVVGRQIKVSAVNTGSTHCVIWRDRLPGDDEFFSVSPIIELHPAFPERTSVMWAVQEGPDRVRLRIWERGAGETLGCGTGACAVGVVACRSGRVPGGYTEVESKGGVLGVFWNGGASDSVHLTGAGEIVFSGVVTTNA